jgi:hypothetical protein
MLDLDLRLFSTPESAEAPAPRTDESSGVA